MSCAGSDVHVKGQDLQLFCFVSAHQQDRLDSVQKDGLITPIVFRHMFCSHSPSVAPRQLNVVCISPTLGLQIQTLIHPLLKSWTGNTDTHACPQLQSCANAVFCLGMCTYNILYMIYDVYNMYTSYILCMCDAQNQTLKSAPNTH